MQLRHGEQVGVGAALVLVFQLAVDGDDVQIDGIINNLPAPPPEDKPLDKVREHPPKRRSREREER